MPFVRAARRRWVLIVAAWAAASACRAGQQREVDSPGADTIVGGAAAATVVGVRPGSNAPIGGPGSAECATYPVSMPNSTLTGDPRTAPQHEERRFADHARTLCFGILSSQVDPVFEDTTTNKQQRMDLWLQPELRMHNTNPQTIPAGSGMIVAMIRNPDQANGAQPHIWDAPLPPRQEAFVWFGRDSGGNAYSYIFRITGNGNNIQRISPKRLNAPRPARWEYVDQGTPRDTAIARWDPHAHPAGVQPAFFQPKGSGWITCLRGCCTALSLSVEE